MKNLLIVGTGGFAREVYWHAQNSFGYDSEFRIKGFLEGNVPLHPDMYSLLPLPVLNNIINYNPLRDDVYVIAIANSEVKEKISEIILDKGGSFFNLIHKTAMVSSKAVLGEDVILCPYVMVSCNTVVGSHVMFNAYSDLGHDAVVGNFTSIMCHVDITGNVKVGSHTFWGSGARALPGSKIGDHATVGAGSVVLRKVKANTTVFGNPAMEI